MATVGSTFTPPLTVTESDSGFLISPQVANFDMPASATVYEIELPLGTKYFTMKPRKDAILKVRDALAGVPYFTLAKGEDYSAGLLKGALLTTIKLYVESNVASQTLEVFYWI